MTFPPLNNHHCQEPSPALILRPANVYARPTLLARSITSYDSVPSHPIPVFVYLDKVEDRSIEKDELKLGRNEADERILEDKGG